MILYNHRVVELDTKGYWDLRHRLTGAYGKLLSLYSPFRRLAAPLVVHQLRSTAASSKLLRQLLSSQSNISPPTESPTNERIIAAAEPWSADSPPQALVKAAHTPRIGKARHIDERGVVPAYISSRIRKASKMMWSVRVISVPGPDTDLALYVNFDQHRYLFGCGEATQRSFVQKRIPWRSLKGIFIGSSTLSRRSGLPGEMLVASCGLEAEALQDCCCRPLTMA